MESFDNLPTAADYAQATADGALARAKANRKNPFKPKNFKIPDLFEEIGRGVITPNCKICGAVVHDKEQHLKWHNVLNKVLSGWVPE